MTKNTILIIGDNGTSTASIAQVLSDNGFQVSSLEASRLPMQAVEALAGGAEVIVVPPKELKVRKLILHHLTNISRNLLGPITTVEESVRSDAPGLRQVLTELTPLMKEAAEQLNKDLMGVTGLEEIYGPESCNLIDAICQAQKAYGASLAHSGIRLTVKVDEALSIAAPAYLISLAVSNTIDNAIDAILETQGGVERELRIESDVEAGTVVCHIINSGVIDVEHVQHIFRKRYSTKKHGRGMGLQLVAECLAEYSASLTLTSPGPPETIFSFRFQRAPRVEPAGS
jgi:signal transduction histidine kinase